MKLFSISVTAEGVFNTLRVKGDYTETYSRTPGTTPTTFSQVFEAETTEDQVGQIITLTFEAVDDQSIATSTDFSFTVISPTARVYSAILLAAPLDDGAGTKASKTFFSTNTGDMYTMDEVNGTTTLYQRILILGIFMGQ